MVWAIKRCTICLLNSTYLVSSPVPNKISTSFLKQINMTSIKWNSTFLPNTTIWVTRTTFSSSCYVVIVFRRRVEVPITRSHSCSRTFCSRISTFVRISWTSLSISWFHTKWDIHSINNFNIIEVYSFPSHCEFSLSGRLLKALWWNTLSLTIISTVGCLAYITSAVGPTCNSSTPNNIKTFILINRYLDTLLSICNNFKAISCVRVFPKTLFNESCYNAFCACKTISIWDTRGRCSALTISSWSSCKSEPYWIFTLIFKHKWSVGCLLEWWWGC